MIRILNAEPEGYSDDARAILRGLGQLDETALDRASLLTCLRNYDVLIVRLGHHVDAEMIDAGRRLKAIATATTGLGHVDTHHAAARDVAVLSLQGETEFLESIRATAEHTWALLLALLRRIPAAVESVRVGEWDRDRFRGRELSGRRLGVLGLGRVGRQVAGYGLAFGMTVTAHDPRAEDWPTRVECASGLDDLLQRADVLCIHVPLRSETTELLGSRELALLPRGAVVVNTARGEVVDENALVEALRDGRLAGAAVDVVARESDAELRARSPLLSYARQNENLIVTPHIGGATTESMKRTEIFMANKLARFLAERGLVPEATTRPTRPVAT